MKTPREILIKRHQAIEPKLDAIRETAVASLDDRRTANSPVVTDRRYNWHELFFSLRWHLAGMSAAWLVAALLSLNAGHSPGLAASAPAQKIPSAKIIMASLRENRRELLQMIQSPDARDAAPQRLIPPQPRSQRRYENLTT